MKKSFSPKGLAFCGIALALAFVLSFVKLFKMPFGGSVTLCSMFFICIVGFFLGPVYSFTVAFAYGLLQFIFDPQFFAPMQFVVDYMFAFTALGASGLLWKKKYGLYTGYILAITLRFIFTTLSGVIFFAEYAPEGMNAWLYSICYNGGYIYAEGLLTIILISLPPVKNAIMRAKNTFAGAEIPQN